MLDGHEKQTKRSFCISYVVLLAQAIAYKNSHFEIKVVSPIKCMSHILTNFSCQAAPFSQTLLLKTYFATEK